MNKYNTYLGRMVKELEGKRIEVEYSKHPGQQVNKMREFYTKGTRLNNYFSHYRDKGTGRENYYNFLRAQKQYEWKHNPQEKEGKVITSFENIIFNPPRTGRKGGYNPWNREDWMVYEAVISNRLDYSWQGFLTQKW